MNAAGVLVFLFLAHQIAQAKSAVVMVVAEAAGHVQAVIHALVETVFHLVQMNALLELENAQETIKEPVEIMMLIHALNGAPGLIVALVIHALGVHVSLYALMNAQMVRLNALPALLIRLAARAMTLMYAQNGRLIHAGLAMFAVEAVA